MILLALPSAYLCYTITYVRIKKYSYYLSYVIGCIFAVIVIASFFKWDDYSET